MSDIRTRLIRKDVSVAGFAQVLTKNMRQALGHSAFHVWSVLVEKSDHMGMTHITTQGIARCQGFVPMKPRTVKKALATLRSLGLLVDQGWRRAVVPGAKRPIKTYWRQVFGAPLLATMREDATCAVPKNVKEAISVASGWGGKRPRAGRKPLQRQCVKGTATAVRKPLPVQSKNALPLQCGNHPQGDESTVSLPKSSVSLPHGIQVCPAIVNTKSTHVERGVTWTSSSFQEKKNAPPGGASFRPLVLDETEAGFSGSVTRTPLMLSTPIPDLPPYPGNSIISPATVPDPAKLTTAHDDADRVRILAAAFRGAVEHQYGVRCYLLAKVSPRAKSWNVLVRASLKLLEYDVSPVAWCTWAVRRWYLARTHSPGYAKGGPVPSPPIGVVFSTKGIDDRCADEERRYVVQESAVGGRVIFGATHKTLIRRYTEMRAAINRGMSPKEAKGKFFPGTKFDDMVEGARVEAIEIRSRLEEDIRRGTHVW